MDMTTTEKYNTLIEKIPAVFEAGKAQGGGGDNNFWEGFLEGRTDLAYAFYAWNASAFYPTKNISPVQSGRMFYYFNNTPQTPFNLKERLEECGVTIDFSNSRNVDFMFGGSYVSELPELKFLACTKLVGIFNLCTCLETIEKLVLKEDGTQTFDAASFNATALKHITVEGKIGTDVTFQSCPLTVASMKSVITHLVNYSGTDKAYTYTVKFSDACWEVLEADSTSPTGTTWAEYVDDLGWNR